jgi:dihydrofolate reductase
MSLPGRIEGYAIVSEEGMIAESSGTFPAALHLAADQRFFEFALEGVAAVAHGRHSKERHPASSLRRRLILTRRVPTLAVDPTNARALLWNPAGASLAEAWEKLAAPGGRLAVIGGTEVFGMFLDRYDEFHLSRAANVWLPGGRPVFPEVPGRTPEEVLAAHGMAPGECLWLDAENGVTVAAWHRSP